MDDPKPLERTRSRLRLILGSLLIVIAAALAIAWFYLLVPMRHRADHDWMAQHSALGRWQEEQRLYHRLGISPDLVFRADTIHLNGDKTWFKWLLDHINSESSSFRVCGCTFTCLAYISNHSFDNDAEWNRWYEANKAKSQEEWIQDGFATEGTKVSLPPSKDDTEALLSVLGKLSDEPKAAGERLRTKFASPSFLRYNTFRWLRDMGFDPVRYLLEHQGATLRPELAEGLTQFHNRELATPLSNGVGLLAFAKRADNDWDFAVAHEPPIARPETMLIVVGLILACSVSAILLIRRSSRLKSAPASPTSRPPDTGDDPPSH